MQLDRLGLRKLDVLYLAAVSARAWQITAIVLMLMPLSAWWNWPRGDERFVGKWKRGGNLGTAQFHLSGRVDWFDPEGKLVNRQQWRVIDNEMHLYYGWLDGFGVSREWELFRGAIEGRNAVMKYTIAPASKDRVNLVWMPGGFGTEVLGEERLIRIESEPARQR